MFCRILESTKNISTTVPSEAIATANEKVRDVLDKSCDGKRLQRGPY